MTVVNFTKLDEKIRMLYVSLFFLPKEAASGDIVINIQHYTFLFYIFFSYFYFMTNAVLISNCINSAIASQSGDECSDTVIVFMCTYHRSGVGSLQSRCQFECEWCDVGWGGCKNAVGELTRRPFTVQKRWGSLIWHGWQKKKINKYKNIKNLRKCFYLSFQRSSGWWWNCLFL